MQQRSCSAACVCVSVFDSPNERACNQLVHCVQVQDEATMRELTTEDFTQDVKGWLQSVQITLFRPDMAAIVRSDHTLIRIHSTAEQFEAIPESFMGFFQVSTCS